jgi:methionyl-tRNA formyltransferase
MKGQFSRIPLEKLLAARIDVGGVMVPASPPTAKHLPRRVEPGQAAFSDLPIVEPYLEQTVIQLAWAHQIPVWEVGSLNQPATMALLAELQPELIVVVCFPRIFPPALLALPRFGCLNLHPSLLPAYRGPAPLFWIARQDERETGVTLHFLDEGIDSGDIVGQAAFEREDGLSEAELEQRCAAVGADLLITAIRQLEAEQPLPGTPQPEAGASYFPWPGEADYVIPNHWPARRAFNFLRGAAGWPLKVLIEAEARTFIIRVAISYSAEQQLEQPYQLFGDEAWFQFQPGVLRAKIYPQELSN